MTDPLYILALQRKALRQQRLKPAPYVVRADDVAACASEGLTTTQIADLLGVSPGHARGLWRVVCAEVGESVLP